LTEITLPPDRDRVEPVDIQQEMQRSYIDYAMSVIVGRALPDVRDGLKPVHRRVLYSMYDSGFRPDRGFVKCARVVGDVMGNYHPHGDTAIYDTLVRMAQPWVIALCRPGQYRRRPAGRLGNADRVDGEGGGLCPGPIRHRRVPSARHLIVTRRHRLNALLPSERSEKNLELAESGLEFNGPMPCARISAPAPAVPNP